MKSLVAIWLMLASLCAQAATYYADFNAAVNGTGSQGSPWNSPANIDAATIAPSDTVCARGTYVGAGWTVTEAGSSGNVTVYDFNCSGWGQGSITATSGTAAVLANKGFTTIKNGLFTYASGPAIQVNASDLRIEYNTIDGGDQGILLTNASTRDRVVITRNTVKNVQGNGSSDASAAGIYMLHTAVSSFHWQDLEISYNYLENNLQGGINLKCDVGASSCGFSRLTIKGNTVYANDNTGIVLQHCYDGVDTAGTCADPTSYTIYEALGAGAKFLDVIIEDNVVTYQTAGGGIAVYGLISSTAAHGKNFIRRNVSSYNVGVIGGIDLFNSRYVTVSGNTTNFNSTSTIDANGVLIDYGNKNTVVKSNFARGNAGLAGTPNSGAAIMLLKCDDIDVHGNVGVGNAVGLFTAGASFTEANCRVVGNTFWDNSVYGWYVDNSQASTSVEFKNNAVSAPVCIEAESSGAAQTDSNNDLRCGTQLNNNGVTWTLGASTLNVDPKFLGGSVPVSAAGFRLKSSSPLIGAGVCHVSVGCTLPDFLGRRHRKPPNIGAFATGSGDRP